METEIDQDLEGAFDEAFADEPEAVGAADAAVEHHEAATPGSTAKNEAEYMQEDDYDDDAKADSSGRAAPAPLSFQGLLSAGLGPAPPVPAPEHVRRPEAPVVGMSNDPAAQYKKDVFECMTEDQKNRYEAFMRCSLNKAKMKKLMQVVLKGAVPHEKALIAMCGISKIFLGELVELARVCASQEGHTGPLLPRHIHRAYQHMGGSGKLTHKPKMRRLFR